MYEITDLVATALTRNGLNADSAAAIAEVSGFALLYYSPVIECIIVGTPCLWQNITEAERDGCASHGLFRLPGYCRSLQMGKVNGSVMPVVEESSAPAVVRIDARGSFAPLAIKRGLPMLAKKAKANGVAVLCISNTFHFAALWVSLFSCKFFRGSNSIRQPEVEKLASEGFALQSLIRS